MMRKLDFNSSLNETLNATLKQSPFPNFANRTPLYHQGASSNQAPNATPIGMMMEVKRWVSDLRNVILDEETGFLASLNDLFTEPAVGKKNGAEIKNLLEQWILQVLKQLVANTVRPEFVNGASETIIRKHSEPIYKICCRLTEKILQQ